MFWRNPGRRRRESVRLSGSSFTVKYAFLQPKRSDPQTYIRRWLWVQWHASRESQHSIINWCSTDSFISHLLCLTEVAPVQTWRLSEESAATDCSHCKKKKNVLTDVHTFLENCGYMLYMSAFIFFYERNIAMWGYAVCARVTFRDQFSRNLVRNLRNRRPHFNFPYSMVTRESLVEINRKTLTYEYGMLYKDAL